jgi:hypothetical protein
MMEFLKNSLPNIFYNISKIHIVEIITGDAVSIIES